MNQGENTTGYTATEQMVISAAREIKDGDIIYVGVGLPTLATWLAKYTHAPNCTVIHQVGIIRTVPCPMVTFMDAPETQTMSDSLNSLFYVNALAQRGFVNVGFIGAGQIDIYGNVNSTAVGDYCNPLHRWAGSGGANDVSSFCNNVITMLNQSKRRFPEKVDFITSPGYLDGMPGQRERHGLRPNTGPVLVITDMGTYIFENREMVLKSVHTDIGVTLEKVKAEIGWDIKVSSDLEETKPPTEEELYTLREKVDPDKIFVGGKFAVLRDQD